MGKYIADPYQPTSSKLWKSLVILGIAVVMMVCGCFLALLEAHDKIPRLTVSSEAWDRQADGDQ